VLEYDKFEDRTAIRAEAAMTTVDSKSGTIEWSARLDGTAWDASRPPRIRLYISEFDPYEVMAGGLNFVLTGPASSERLTPDTASSSRFGYLELEEFDRILAAPTIELQWGMLRFEVSDQERGILEELREAIADSRN
jgi:hypothetical protein